MSPDELLVTAVQRNALTELLTLGAARASRSLGELTEEEIDMSVPRVHLHPGRTLLSTLAHELRNGSGTVVSQDFAGAIEGTACVVFPLLESLELVRVLILERDTPLESISELELEALEEVANIVINACLSGLADALDLDLSVRLPRSHSFGALESLCPCLGEAREEELVLFASVDFALKQRTVRSFLDFVVTIRSARELAARLEAFVERRRPAGA